MCPICWACLVAHDVHSDLILRETSLLRQAAHCVAESSDIHPRQQRWSQHGFVLSARTPAGPMPRACPEPARVQSQRFQLQACASWCSYGCRSQQRGSEGGVPRGGPVWWVQQLLSQHACIFHCPTRFYAFETHVQSCCLSLLLAAACQLLCLASRVGPPTTCCCTMHSLQAACFPPSHSALQTSWPMRRAFQRTKSNPGRPTPAGRPATWPPACHTWVCPRCLWGR
jgi:hypothetical protein